MSTILLVVQIILSLLLAGFVLLQRSDSDGLGLGGSSGGSGLFSARGQANFLTRTTSIIAALFFVNCLLLNIVSAQNSSSTLIDEIAEETKTISVPKDGVTPPDVNSPAQEATPAVETPTTESTPAPAISPPPADVPNAEVPSTIDTPTDVPAPTDAPKTPETPKP
ncbi:MAG: preprotein translocase subunit SecG [Alphaproteobacteria bacterium]|nr:MAG: preprotein translocase subunit SecG [Alphaproteobacteria bacterium]TAF15007.1 MAG: preprotein translocase subunit SecG [Alphaproteobacteria bacterium]TAF40433.1 MAG: preprotein translocase subunit SecG [Alphaproteobacteria bacterium]TAF76653.1 MAG: preprotein translocase subunit SecG [Alphaproteobacteria bacterium]